MQRGADRLVPPFALRFAGCHAFVIRPSSIAAGLPGQEGFHLPANHRGAFVDISDSACSVRVAIKPLRFRQGDARLGQKGWTLRLITELANIGLSILRTGRVALSGLSMRKPGQGDAHQPVQGSNPHGESSRMKRQKRWEPGNDARCAERYETNSTAVALWGIQLTAAARDCCDGAGTIRRPKNITLRRPLPRTCPGLDEGRHRWKSWDLPHGIRRRPAAEVRNVKRLS